MPCFIKHSNFNFKQPFFLVNKCLFNIQYVEDTVLGTGDFIVKRKSLLSESLYISRDRKTKIIILKMNKTISELRGRQSDNVVDSDGEGNNFAEWLKKASLS